MPARIIESPLHGLLLVLALAGAVRIAHLHQASSNPLFDYPAGTARAYAAAAGTTPVAGGSATAWSQAGPLIEVSPFARFYAVSLTAAGGDRTPVQIANQAAGVAACLLVYGIACALFTPGTALAAGLGAAIYGPLIHFGAELTPALWVVFLLLLVAYVLVRPGRTGVRLGVAAALALVAVVEAVAWQAPRIPDSPWQFLTNIYYLLQGVELLPDLDPYRDRTGVMSVLLWHRGLAFPAGVVMPLGAVGLLSRLRSRSLTGVTGITVLLGLLLLALAAVAPDARHRLPLALLLLPFAAHALLRGFATAGRRPRALLFLVLLLGANAGLAAPPHLEGRRQHDYWTGVAYAEKQMYYHANEAFDQVLARDPSHGEALLASARLATRYGQIDRALPLYEASLRENPGSSEVLYEMGKALAAADRFHEAVDVFEKARAAGDSSLVLLGALGHARFMGGDFDGAADAYLAAVQTRPDSVILRYRLAHAYEAGHRTDRAIEQYRLLLKGSPGTAGVHARLGELLLFREEAREGSIYLERNETTREAEDHLRTAVSLHPDLKSAHRTLAMLLSKQRRYDEAIGQFERLRELNPNDYELHRLLANLHERAGNPGEASRRFDLFRRLQREMEIQALVEEKARALAGELMGKQAPP